MLVAPHVGAWIETSDAGGDGGTSLSRPTWARGLKLNGKAERAEKFGRAPRGRVD